MKGVAREEEGEGECASAVENYMEQLEEVVRYSLPRDGRVAAFFAESIQATVALLVSTIHCMISTLSSLVDSSMSFLCFYIYTAMICFH